MNYLKELLWYLNYLIKYFKIFYFCSMKISINLLNNKINFKHFNKKFLNFNFNRFIKLIIFIPFLAFKLYVFYIVQLMKINLFFKIYFIINKLVHILKSRLQYFLFAKIILKLNQIIFHINQNLCI